MRASSCAGPPRLRVPRTASAEIVFWLAGARFRLRDETGRPFPDVLADVTAARGLGATARSMEDFMGAWTPTEHARRPTEVFVDAASDEAFVIEADADPWRRPAAELLALTDQVLSHGRETGLRPAGERRFLDRVCREYLFTIEGEEQGTPYRTEVGWLVSGPYILRRELRDSTLGRLSVVSEVVELDEGVVGDADVVFTG